MNILLFHLISNLRVVPTVHNGNTQGGVTLNVVFICPSSPRQQTDSHLNGSVTACP